MAVSTTIGAAILSVKAFGFTVAGISAGSIAAKMMSAYAIANGGGVAAGGVVASLQSVGTMSVLGPIGLIGTGIGFVGYHGVKHILKK